MQKLLILFTIASIVTAVPVENVADDGPAEQYYQHQDNYEAEQPQQQQHFVPIVEQSFDRKDDGQYRFGYVSGDGSRREEHGIGGVSVTGSYAFVAPDGKEVQVNYIADEFGFRVVGNVIAEEIQRAAIEQAEYAKAHPQQNEAQSQEGKGRWVDQHQTNQHEVAQLSQYLEAPAHGGYIGQTLPLMERVEESKKSDRSRKRGRWMPKEKKGTSSSERS